MIKKLEQGASFLFCVPKENKAKSLFCCFCFLLDRDVTSSSLRDMSQVMVAHVSETQVQDRLRFQRQEGGAYETRADRMGSVF